MNWQQVIMPNVNIKCTPGMCLVYARQAVNAPATGKYPTALSNWNASARKHADLDFPAGMWVPVWFTVKGNPAGHVAWLAPDLSVYSSSSPTSNTPVHHPSLGAMYSYWGNGVLGILGWTEDVEDTVVVKEGDQVLKPEQVNSMFRAYWGRDASAEEQKQYTGTDVGTMIATLDVGPARAAWAQAGAVGAVAVNDKWSDQIDLLSKQLTAAQGGKPTSATVDKQAVIDYLSKNLN